MTRQWVNQIQCKLDDLNNRIEEQKYCSPQKSDSLYEEKYSGSKNSMEKNSQMRDSSITTKSTATNGEKRFKGSGEKANIEQEQESFNISRINVCISKQQRSA